MKHAWMLQCFISCPTRRSSQQIRNVTIFFLFFMSLYGILGVQFFGELKHHCVKNGTDPQSVEMTFLVTFPAGLQQKGFLILSILTVFFFFFLSLLVFSSRNISISDLAIPDTYCSPHVGTGYQCPTGMLCMDLNLSRGKRGFNGFEDFGR